MAQQSTVPGVMPIEDRGYARPDVLVSTDWVADHLNDPKVRLVESDEDLLLYESGHIPGAVKVDWVADLNDPLVRDYVNRERLQAVLRSKGINRDTTIVFYGDKNNWWACYSFWVLRLFGVENLKIMDGGRMRWAQEGRPLETTTPSYPEGNITVAERNDPAIRAFRDDVMEHVRGKRFHVFPQVARELPAEALPPADRAVRQLHQKRPPPRVERGRSPGEALVGPRSPTDVPEHRQGGASLRARAPSFDAGGRPSRRPAPLPGSTGRRRRASPCGRPGTPSCRPGRRAASLRPSAPDPRPSRSPCS